MINCKKCTFNVDQGMKFALMKNMCPSCGAPLFTKKEESDINTIQNRIINQEFAAEFSEEQIYDVSLFIFSEMKSGFGQVFIQRELEAFKKQAPNESQEIEETDINELRKEVAKEVGADLLPENVDEYDDDEEELEGVVFKRAGEDVDDKVRRLRRMARSNNKKAGPAVKRLG